MVASGSTPKQERHMNAIAFPARLAWTGLLATSFLLVAAAAAPLLQLAARIII